MLPRTPVWVAWGARCCLAPWESCHRAGAEHTAERKPEGKSPQAAPVGDSLAVS